MELRTIVREDIELLREWKNQHRQFFFHKGNITEKEQSEWYERWSQFDDDHLFMIISGSERVGCIGTRFYNKTSDIYNVILGAKEYGGKGVMADALYATIAISQFLRPAAAVCVRVLRENPAVGWYKRNGFVEVTANVEFVTMMWSRIMHKDFKCEMSLVIPVRKR